MELALDRLEFLGRLPLLLNSSLEQRKIIEVALQHLSTVLKAEAATVFTFEEQSRELLFWAPSGQEAGRLQGKRMPADKGIVGWVINHKTSVLVPDATKDDRFFRIVDSEGKTATRDVLCAPLLAQGQKVIGALEVINSLGDAVFKESDLSFLEQVANQLALALQNAKLYQNVLEQSHKLAVLEKRKGEVITIITHEFRTPLTLIQGAAELLASSKTSDQALRDKLGFMISQGVERLTRLVARARDLALVSEPQKLEISPEAVKIVELTSYLESHFSQALQKRNIKLECGVSPTLPAVKADRALILMVLCELLSNAIRFTPDHGQICINAQSNSGMVRLTVKDTGIGISAQELPLIFEKFYEVGDAKYHSSGQFEFKSAGLGVGLATAKAILQAHGSKLEVQSELGKGSIFEFHLAMC